MDLDDLLGGSHPAMGSGPTQPNEGKNALDFFNDVGALNFNHNSAPVVEPPV